MTALEAEKRKTYPVLFKWLKVNFAEAYQAWIHIKVSFFAVFCTISGFLLTSAISTISVFTSLKPFYLFPSSFEKLNNF